VKEIGSEFTLNVNRKQYFKSIKNLVGSILFLRSGREAIGYVADLIIKKSGIVLLPAYSCKSMSDPFLIRGWRILYYPVDYDFSVDVQYLLTVSDKYKPDIVLIMNYFGISDTKYIAESVKSRLPNIKIIEDVTHILFDLDKLVNNQVDFLVGSIRKWIGITDGAIAIAKNSIIHDICYVESDFVNLRKIALKLKEEYIHTNEVSLKQKYRRIFADAEVSLGNGETPHQISPDSLDLLYDLNVESLKNIRRWNALKLKELIKTMPQVKLPRKIDIISENTPFSFPIFINERDIIQKKMAENGIYAQILWPLCEEARKISPASEKIEKTILSIPIDQRYDCSDIEQIFNVIKKVMY